MDELPPLGTAINEVVLKTMAIYEPLLLQNAETIASTPRKTFSYGQYPRQALDVYYPSPLSNCPDQSDGPILIFLYGGGLVRGDKTLPNNYARGLVHANVGHFFASKFAYTTVVPDYRLISHGAKFPSGGEDVALVVEWVSKNLTNDAKTPRDLYIMGNSAGGVHLSTYLFAPMFEESRRTVLLGSALRTCLRGVILLSVPFQFKHAVPTRAETLQAYFGDHIDERCPLGLLVAAQQKRQSQAGTLLHGMHIFVLNGSLDPEDEILIPRKDFLTALEKTDLAVTVDMMKGHNHISPPFSLGTARGNEEAWGYRVGKWIGSCMPTQ